MEWLQVSLVVDASLVPRVEAAFVSLDALSVTSAPATSGERWLEVERDEPPAWAAQRITGLFAADADRQWIRQVLAPVAGARQPTFDVLPDRAWATTWLEHFRPIPFERFWIVPASGPAIDTAGKPAIALDPGAAFGSGTHESTALCLDWLDAHDLTGQRVVDYGCGSGILAIAAARLGAASVWGCDIDPSAVQVSAANALANGVSHTARFIEPARLPAAPVDVVLANLLLGALLELEPRLSELTVPGGHLVLAGLLDEQGAEVIRAYAPHFDLSVSARRGDWLRVSGTRRRS